MDNEKIFPASSKERGISSSSFHHRPLVFKDKSKYQRFVAHYGGSIPVVYKPDLGSSMDVLQDFKIKAEVYKRLTAGNHQRSSSLMTQDPRENQ